MLWQFWMGFPPENSMLCSGHDMPFVSFWTCSTASSPVDVLFSRFSLFPLVPLPNTLDMINEQALDGSTHPIARHHGGTDRR